MVPWNHIMVSCYDFRVLKCSGKIDICRKILCCWNVLDFSVNRIKPFISFIINKNPFNKAQNWTILKLIWYEQSRRRWIEVLLEPDHQELLPLSELGPELMTLFDDFFLIIFISTIKMYDLIGSCIRIRPNDMIPSEMKRKITRILSVCARKQQVYDGFYGWLDDFFPFGVNPGLPLLLKSGYFPLKYPHFQERVHFSFFFCKTQVIKFQEK